MPSVNNNNNNNIPMPSVNDNNNSVPINNNYNPSNSNNNNNLIRVLSEGEIRKDQYYPLNNNYIGPNGNNSQAHQIYTYQTSSNDSRNYSNNYPSNDCCNSRYINSSSHSNNPNGINNYLMQQSYSHPQGNEYLMPQSPQNSTNINGNGYPMPQPKTKIPQQNVNTNGNVYSMPQPQTPISNNLNKGYYSMAQHTPSRNNYYPTQMTSTIFNTPPQNFTSLNYNSKEYGNNSSFNNNDSMYFGNFNFKKRREHLDWRMLASIQLDSILYNVDIQKLQEILYNITFSNIEFEDTSSFDPNLVKLFQIAQLIIEYLLYSQNVLKNSSKAYNDKMKYFENEAIQQKERADNLNNECIGMRKELRKMKKVIRLMNIMVPIYRNNTMNNVDAGGYKKCKICSKLFHNSSFLISHMQRRHPDIPIERHVIETINTSDRNNTGGGEEFNLNIDNFEKITNFINRFTSKIKVGENEIREQLEKKMNQEVLQKQKELELAFEQERLKYRNEINTIKTEFHQKLEEERNIYQEQYEKLLKSKKSSSNIGSIEDAEDIEDDNINLNQKYIDSKNSVEELTEHVNEKIDNIRKDLLSDFSELAGKIQPLQRCNSNELTEIIENSFIHSPDKDDDFDQLNKTLDSTLNKHNHIGIVNAYKNNVNGRRNNFYNEDIDVNDHDDNSTPVPPRQKLYRNNNIPLRRSIKKGNQLSKEKEYDKSKIEKIKNQLRNEIDQEVEMHFGTHNKIHNLNNVENNQLRIEEYIPKKY